MRERISLNFGTACVLSQERYACRSSVCSERRVTICRVSPSKAKYGAPCSSES